MTKGDMVVSGAERHQNLSGFFIIYAGRGIIVSLSFF